MQRFWTLRKTRLAKTLAAKMRKASPRDAFERLYTEARVSDIAGKPETTATKARAALSLLEANDIYGERQANVARALRARLHTLEI